MMNLAPELRAAIEKAGQSHLLEYSSGLLAAQLEEIDWESLPELIQNYVVNKPQMTIPEDLQPAPYFPLVPRNKAEEEKKAHAKALGIELLKSGKAACLTVAGGAGDPSGF